MTLAIGLAGCGQLGGAIGRALLRTGFVRPDQLWIANRSGDRSAFVGEPGLHWTSDLQELSDCCALILLVLPPAAARTVRLSAPDRLVVSVMAGVGVAQLQDLAGTARVVRAMSSPAAELGLAYSPWYAAPGVGVEDKALVGRMFAACGVTDEVPEEAQLDTFTAITGPVPGFVALFAESMHAYAVRQGVAPAVAERAVRQLFLAGGQMLATSKLSPEEHVRAMIDYAGTTAAGMLQMRARGLEAAIDAGLEAARRRSATIAG